MWDTMVYAYHTAPDIGGSIGLMYIIIPLSKWDISVL